MNGVERVRTVLWVEPVFVDIRECTELPRVRYADDLSGVIMLTVSQVPVIDEDLVTDIESLWGSVGNLVDGYRKNGRAESSFPDQPVDIALEPVPRGLLRITVSGKDWKRTSVAGEKELLSALVAGGVEFYEKMTELTARGFGAEMRKLTGE
ncbi:MULTISPECIES: hypothetical protein [Amycolatopsis]|uniref:Uncharacterized protein n=1 Tax=Amycolatopsis dendrobii TaxID=2760662 RepID=A0A7W3VYM6_9PSEU|nr:MULTISPECIES: hypothetical protein [Amycolatopsis]MBB1155633.1 hypothetical protein [Amycolatopsis dendrobii]UKD52845.1 hypothetical protein L3Q65_33780 [Amycolatopsis sp. FU40]